MIAPIKTRASSSGRPAPENKADFSSMPIDRNGRGAGAGRVGSATARCEHFSPDGDGGVHRLQGGSRRLPKERGTRHAARAADESGLAAGRAHALVRLVRRARGLYLRTTLADYTYGPGIRIKESQPIARIAARLRDRARLLRVSLTGRAICMLAANASQTLFLAVRLLECCADRRIGSRRCSRRPCQDHPRAGAGAR